MGRTPKPLRFLVDNRLVNHLEIKALEAKGHEVTPMVAGDFDLILGPTCWRMDESLLDYLELAIKGARTVKYPKKETKDVSPPAA